MKKIRIFLKLKMKYLDTLKNQIKINTKATKSMIDDTKKLTKMLKLL